MASKASSATINETPLSQADPFVKMSVTAILGGMASKASGGDFVQGAMSAMVVWLYNEAGHGAGRHYKPNKHLLPGKMTLSRVLTGLGGVAQVVAGEGLCDTGVGCLVGGPLMLHGTSNIHEFLNGDKGYLKKGYIKSANILNKKFDLNLNGELIYYYADLVLSLGAAGADLTKMVGWKELPTANEAITGYKPLYKIQTLSGAINMGAESVFDANTIMSIQEIQNKQ